MRKGVIAFLAGVLAVLSGAAATCRITVTTVHAYGDGLRLLPTSAAGVYVADASTEEAFQATVLPDRFYELTDEGAVIPAGVSYDPQSGFVEISADVLAAQAETGLALTVTARPISYAIDYRALGDGEPSLAEGTLVAQAGARVWRQHVSAGDEAVTLAAAGTLHAEGWRFLGWSRTPGVLKSEYEPGAVVDPLTVMDTNVVRLYAVWETAPEEGKVSYPAALQNGGFESPVLTTTYQHLQGARIGATEISDPVGIGWSTTESGNRIEIGNLNDARARTLYGLDEARDGSQIAELNAVGAGLLYQRIATLPNTTLHWGFSHRCRGIETSEETLAMWIGSPDQIAAARAIYDRFALLPADDPEHLPMAEAMARVADLAATSGFTNVLHTAYKSDDRTHWDDIRGNFLVPSGLSATEYAFVSWLEGSNGTALSSGNLIDRVYLSGDEPPETRTLSVTVGDGGVVWVNDSSEAVSRIPAGSAYLESLELGTRVHAFMAVQPGYTFAGVMTNGVFVAQADVSPVFQALDQNGLTSNLRLEFVFSRDATVMFRPNGGVYSNLQGEEVSEVQLSPARPLYTLLAAVREGYNFLGWRERGGVLLPLGAVVSYGVSASGVPTLTVTQDDVELVSVPSADGLTLYAQWELDEEAVARRETHTVYLTAVNARGDGSIMHQRGETAWEGAGYASEEFVTTVFPADGYRLPETISVSDEQGGAVEGWTYNNLTGVIVIPGEQLTRNLSISVFCERIRYTIVYTSGGTGQIAGVGVEAVEGTTGVWQQEVVAQDLTVTLATQGTLAADGWSFLGWSRTADATDAEFAAGAAVPHLTRLDLTVVKLYGIWKAGDGSTQSSYPVMLQNGSFETPSNAQPPSGYNKRYYNQYIQGVAGLCWYTTASSKRIEIASVSPSLAPDNAIKNYHTALARDGEQFAELNADTIGALYQDVATVPGVTLYYGFSHKARESGDALALLIGSPEDFARALAIYTEEVAARRSGWQESVVSRIQALEGSSLKIVYSAAPYDASDLYGWVDFKGEYTVPAGQNVTKFAFLSLSTGSDVTRGNLIDDVYFTTSEPIQTAALTVRATEGGSAMVNDGCAELASATRAEPYFEVLAAGRQVVVMPVAEQGWTFLGCYLGTVYYPRSACTDALAFETTTSDRRITLLFSKDRTITFNAEGGLYPDSSRKLTAAAPSYTLAEPTRTGYVFKGWRELTSGNVYASGTPIRYEVDAQYDENVSSWLVCGEGQAAVRVQSAEGLVLTALWELDPSLLDKLLVTFVDLDWTKAAPQSAVILKRQNLTAGQTWTLSTDAKIGTILSNTTTVRPAGHEPTGWRYEPTDASAPFDFDYVYSVKYAAGEEGGYAEVNGITNGVYQAFRFDNVASMRFVARWDRFYDVTRLEDDGVTTNRVAWVPKSWLDEKGYTGITEDSYRTDLERNGANGLPVWQSYIFGLDPTNALSVALNRPFQHAEDGKATLVLDGVKVVSYLNDIYEAQVGTTKYSSWAGHDYRTYRVSFHLMAADDFADGPWTEVAGPSETPLFEVRLENLVRRYYRIEARVSAR